MTRVTGHASLQATLRQNVEFNGVGLHSGRAVRMLVRPAAAEFGIWFCRTDISDRSNWISAKWNNVVESRLCTLLKNEDGVTVSTVEHIMAALAGCGIHNALIEIDGPEVPILDGSSEPFARKFLETGILELDAPVRAVRVKKVVEVSDGKAFARLEPMDNLWIDFSIEFDDEAIGEQSKSLNLANGAFMHELCDSRTFCRLADVDAMKSAGLALGGTSENAVVVDGGSILSPGGLRHKDEAVRHKMLDALGDLILAGAPLMARYTGHRAGHALTNKLLCKLMDDPSAYEMVICDEQATRRMPGVGVSLADVPAPATSSVA